jgi:Transcriptional regulators
MKATQKEIAEALGLSPASVSLVLNGKPNKLSKESQERILRTASEMNYEARKKLHAEKAVENCIGLIVPSLTNYFFAEVVQGVCEYAQGCESRVLFFTSNGSADADQKAIQLMKSSPLQALLITSSSDCREDIFSSLQCPIIQVDRHSPELHYSSVVLNNRKGGFLATQHLLGLGHRKVAYLSGPTQLESARERLSGFYWAYQEKGLQTSADCVFEGNYQYESGYRAADKILGKHFTAVACGNDVMAYGIIKRCGELGIRVPEDLSIVGFDNLTFSELIKPALTTVSQSGYAIGYRACQLAFQEIEDPKAHKQTILLEPDLVVRNSTAPAEAE